MTDYRAYHRAYYLANKERWNRPLSAVAKAYRYARHRAYITARPDKKREYNRRHYEKRKRAQMESMVK